MKVNHYEENPEFNEPAKVVFFPQNLLDRMSLLQMSHQIGILSLDGFNRVTHLTVELPGAEQ